MNNSGAAVNILYLTGAHLKVKDGGIVKKGDLMAEWDPFSIPILAEVDGIVSLEISRKERPCRSNWMK